MTAKPHVLIIGIGNWMSGDDAVGIVIATRLARRLLRDAARVAFDAAPLWEMVEGTHSADLVVIIDAAEESPGLPAGRWRRLGFPDALETLDTPQLRDTHSLNLDLILRLGEQLDTLPPQVWIYAVAGMRFQLGDPLSRTVARAAEEIEAQIERDVRSWLEMRSCTSSPSPKASATSPLTRPADTASKGS